MERKLVSFDWALKKILRSKANFTVLEGFLTELLKQEITIVEILESESNKETSDDRFNRVDLLTKDSKGELLIIEVQYERESDFFQRMLYGASKVIIEHIQKNDPYSSIKKVISVNIVYFNLGHGKDYIYKGKTEFIGEYENDVLELSQDQKERFQKEKVHDIFPIYYLLKVNNFNDVAKNTLDEWIYFLKNSGIKEEFKAKGLQEANNLLDIAKLSDEERLIYNKYLDLEHSNASWWESTYGDGHRKGLKEGKAEIIRSMLTKGLSIESIMEYTNSTKEEIEGVLTVN